LDDQFLRVSVISEVRFTIAVQIGDDQRGDTFFGRDRIDAKPRVGRKFVQFFPVIFVFDDGVGLAGAVVEQVDFRAQVVDDDEVSETVAVQISRVQ